MQFGRISSITWNKPDSWAGRVFITLDIDWASDPVLEEVIALIESAGIPATWFVTHATPLLKRLRANPLFELGIHPNFNKLLEGNTDNGATPEAVVSHLLTLIPEAVSVRSHSLLQSSRILDLFQAKGLQFDCNDYTSVGAGITLKPWRLYNGLIKIPAFWEDNLQVMAAEGWDAAAVMAAEGLKVLNFHPIHLALNTEDMARYENSRAAHDDLEQLAPYRNTGRGTRTFLEEILARTGLAALT